MKQVIIVLWHCIPIVPAGIGLYYLAAAFLGAVALPYIKVNKIEHQILFLESQDEDNRLEVASLKVLQARWSYLTYINLK
jgi:hypothetical protein